ncbi:MAG TPA: adenylate/guanylate cyclase domain-containing protein [Gaiellaceae bacterium]|nr:adenylate/guanylate cyclase domain-containing protein [Gaiellaceae bacterium]
MAELPRGTVSLLFTDIEGSTQLQHRLQERYREVVNEHRRLLEDAIESHEGLVVDRQTESFFAVFPRMRDAAAAAADAQRAIAAHEWPDDTQVKVRMGLHAGEPELEGDRYVGLAVARAARIGATAHGGQVLLSGAARGLLPERSRVRALGSFPLKDFEAPEPLFQLEVDGVPNRFPRPRVTPRRSRRRSLVIAAALLLVALAAGLAALVLGRSDGGGLSLVQPNNVGVIDPHSNDIVAEVPVGIGPGPIAVGVDGVWVGNTGDRTLARIDPSTRDVVRTVPLDATPTGVAVTRGAVWVVHGRLGLVTRVDPQFDRVAETLDPNVGRSSGGAIDAGPSGVWVTFAGQAIAYVGRIDPTSSRITAEGYPDGRPSAIAVDEDAVWIANGDDSSTVSRIDPRTAIAVQTITVGRGPRAIAVGAGAVWVANSSDDTVSRIDPEASSSATIRVGDAPSAVAVGEGAVWVANAGEGTVSRIEPSTGEVTRTIRVGGRPEGVAVGGGVVWVAVQGP